ncbi:glycosyltransferase family 25 protein [Luteolibacter sp. GHJ8]|uniref:Glycosyltransferase family 25 protein n=1 Tax=Luteolibacter rhizosphaerae TaxID=2989719 RepID=A0ABT3FZ85_9BACT|nr:glycosyltransferase family 25 protein [Luteolibacter rhizosphaerae]MCW1912910.1 glycosyltransferase family 25 protein [Luteolibacter rhizosphaerae]
MKLTDFFEKIFVINLPYKAERRDRLTKHLAVAGLASPEDITWVRAISGDMCPPPDYFKAGGGAWGCLQSHLRIVQDATMDGLGNYLVLEDDVIFHDQSGEHLQRFMSEVPADWDQIYLGGQHLRDPEPVEGSPFVFRGINVNRTHAFALSNKAFRLFQQHVMHAPDYMARAPWHIDHQLGIAHERGDWNVYAPAWWIAGQEEGTSNISGKNNPRYWWNFGGYGMGLPFVFVEPAELEVVGTGELRRYLHFGNHLKDNTLEDVGLDACVGSPGSLQTWLKMIAKEAIGYWKLPAISHPAIPISEVAGNWGTRVMTLGEADLGALCAYPANGLFAHPLNSKVECFGNLVRSTSAA